MQKKAVLCENPFAINSAQVTEMIACARSNNVFLMEAFLTRFLTHYSVALKLIQSCEFGELKFVNANFSYAGKFNPEGRLFNLELEEVHYWVWEYIQFSFRTYH